MSSVTFEDIYIYVESDMSDYQQFTYYQPVREWFDNDGTVRRYAGGRVRSVTRAGKFRKVYVELAWVTREQLEWLVDNVGVLMMLKDNKGRVVFGVYSQVNILDQRVFDEAIVSIVLDEVTHSVEV